MPVMTTLGRLDVRPPDDLDVGVGKLNVFGDALRTVLNLGVIAPGLPLSGFRGEMPIEMTVLDDEQLGDLLNNLSQWCGYIEFELSKATSARDEARAKLEYVRARIRVERKVDDQGRKLSSKDKDDLVEVDPRTVDTNAKHLYCQAVYGLTRVLHDKSQRDWDTVSRRITQRGQAIDRMKRENGVAGIPAPAQNSRAFRR